MRPLAFLFCVALLTGCRSASVPTLAAPQGSPDDAFAIVTAADRLAGEDLWPGFDARAIPVAIYDGERTVLFRHPAPPAGFVVVPGREGVWTFPGRHPAVTANSSARIGGVSTATLIPSTGTVSLLDRAGILIHEAFHVFQREHHPTWQANEAELFTYPVDDAELLTLRRMEAAALRRALLADRPEHAACWGRTALDSRTERFARMPPGAAAYERANELNEGLADYVESVATSRPDSAVLTETGFAPDAVRQRGYRTGTAMGRLLDRFSPGWRAVLAQQDSIPLDVLLFDALRPGEGNAAPCEFGPEKTGLIRATARADVDELRVRRAARRNAFLDQPGWRLVFESRGTPLFPQGFDPVNVQIVEFGEVLHTRWLKVGNPAGTVEVLGRSALSEAAGDHPLFNGVRRLTVAGHASEPLVTETDGVVTVQGEGIAAELTGATVLREAQTVIIRLPEVQ